jgi:hypothetical protein
MSQNPYQSPQHDLQPVEVVQASSSNLWLKRGKTGVWIAVGGMAGYLLMLIVDRTFVAPLPLILLIALVCLAHVVLGGSMWVISLLIRLISRDN